MCVIHFNSAILKRIYQEHKKNFQGKGKSWCYKKTKYSKFVIQEMNKMIMYKRNSVEDSTKNKKLNQKTYGYMAVSDKFS